MLATEQVTTDANGLAEGTVRLSRAVEETVTDTWEWLRGIGGQPPTRADRPAVGLDPAVEAELLGLT